MPHNTVSVCVTCRQAFKQTGGTCPKCKNEMVDMGPRWSAPKKTNSKAWRRIAKGDWWWDHRRIRRVRARWPYENIWRSEVRPTHKPGQETAVMRSWPQPGRELGG